MKTTELLTEHQLSARHHPRAEGPMPCGRRHKGGRSRGCVETGRQLPTMESRRETLGTHTQTGEALHAVDAEMISHTRVF